MINRLCFATARQVLFARWGTRALLAACVLFAILAVAQEESQPQGSLRPYDFAHESDLTDSLSAQLPTGSQTVVKSDEQKKSGSRGSFVVAPMPISSPALGTGLVPVLGYIFPFRKSDKVSPPSVVGVAGLVTNNGTRGFAAYADLFMREDTY